MINNFLKYLESLLEVIFINYILALKSIPFQKQSRYLFSALNTNVIEKSDKQRNSIICHCDRTVHKFFNVENECRRRSRVGQRDNNSTLCSGPVNQED